MTQVATPGSSRQDAPQSGERVHHWIGGRLVAGTSGRVGPVYDPATGWTKRVPERSFGLDSWDLAYATLGGKLYIVGTNYSDYCYYDVSGVYDPASNTMLRFSSPAPLRSGAAGAAAKGQFFVIGGSDYEPDNGGCGDGNGSLTGEVRAYTP